MHGPAVAMLPCNDEATAPVADYAQVAKCGPSCIRPFKAPVSNVIAPAHASTPAAPITSLRPLSTSVSLCSNRGWGGAILCSLQLFLHLVHARACTRPGKVLGAAETRLPQLDWLFGQLLQAVPELCMDIRSS